MHAALGEEFRIEVIKFLMRHNADINIRDKEVQIQTHIYAQCIMLIAHYIYMHT